MSIQYPNIDPVAFSAGSFAIRWYGIMYLVGFMGAFGYCVSQRNINTSPHWKVEDIADLLFYIAMGVIFGGTIGYWLFYEPHKILEDPLLLFKFWQPGRSFHGGLIGVLIALVFFCYNRHRRFLEVTDFISPSIAIGLATGRLGNFLNAELWGRETTVPWGVIFPNAGSMPRHPSQLYEFFLEGILLFIILYLFSRKKRPEGAVSGMFALGYGIFRFLVEFFREPDKNQGFLMGDWLTMGQALSIPMILIGIFLLWFSYSHEAKKKSKEGLICNNI